MCLGHTLITLIPWSFQDRTKFQLTTWVTAMWKRTPAMLNFNLLCTAICSHASMCVAVQVPCTTMQVLHECHALTCNLAQYHEVLCRAWCKCNSRLLSCRSLLYQIGHAGHASTCTWVITLVTIQVVWPFMILRCYKVSATENGCLHKALSQFEFHVIRINFSRLPLLAYF